MAEPEFDPTPAPLRPPVVFDQQWCNVSFLHWPVQPAAIAGLFPAGCRPDTVAGLSYLGLVPFQLRGIALGRGGAIPYFGSFAETNVRLYSVDDAGRHGVVFCSLDTARLAVVPIARLLFGVPYNWARMQVSQPAPDRWHYRSRRRWPGRGPACTLTVRVGRPVRPTPLEEWLTARWGLHARIGGRTRWVPNSHQPWPLHEAEVLELREDVIAAAGLPPSGDRLRALWSPGVRARFGRPVRLD
ncbi:YqjF family protein [Jatrophihabitans sp.]|uniref:YqjF family protein n=1 Tax=Jatrophihabitans sp. TaxID=1932789 RepID=UPI002BD46C9F|nr:DUF2071 domain-containing protein [Jatrophihabitans sp.]